MLTSYVNSFRGQNNSELLIIILILERRKLNLSKMQ